MTDERDAAGAMSRTEVLSRIPLFRILDAEELRQLADLCVEVTFQTGDTICCEGDEGDAFFVVVSGELEVWGGPTGSQVINRLGSGEVVGEMALLTGGKRAATVTVARTARLLALDKAAFDRYLLPNPKMLEYVSRLLCQRLATMARGQVAVKATTAIAITAGAGSKGKSLVASTLALLLARLTERDAVIVRRMPAGGSRSSRGASLGEVARAPLEHIAAVVGRGTALVTVEAVGDGGSQANVEHLTTLIARLGERFPFIVFDLGTDDAALDAAAVWSADVVIELVDEATPRAPETGRPSQRVFQVVNLHNPGASPIPINHSEPFVVPDCAALGGLDPTAQAMHLCDDPWAPAARPLHRLARKLLGASVGIAMGGGAAFGIAHVGMLKVLEDAGVPVDVVVGCSMGSIIALGYAAGLRPDDMIEIANRIGTKTTTLSAVLDFSFIRPALLTGDRMVEIFSPLSGPIKDFEQLVVPCRTVATDIETGERVSIGSGPIAMAFRASSAVPMLWAPVRIGERVLVDGGVADPVPAQVVHEMGADICIAVNAVPPLRKGVDTVLSRLYRRINRWNPFSYLTESQGLPSMFDIVMNTMQVLQHELGNFKAISADIRINPDLSEHTWIEFYRPRELIERGAEATTRALPDIQRLLAERLRASVPPVEPVTASARARA